MKPDPRIGAKYAAKVLDHSVFKDAPLWVNFATVNAWGACHFWATKPTVSAWGLCFESKDRQQRVGFGYQVDSLQLFWRAS